MNRTTNIREEEEKTARRGAKWVILLVKTLSLPEINKVKLGGASNRSEMYIKLQLVILKVTDHFNDDNNNSTG